MSSLNFLDAADCRLEAQAKVNEWMKGFMATYYEPLVRAMINQAIMGAQHSPMIDQQKLNGLLSPQGRARMGEM
jgi:hypothetical protein